MASSNSALPAKHRQIQLTEIFCLATRKEQDQFSTSRDPGLPNGCAHLPASVPPITSWMLPAGLWLQHQTLALHLPGGAKQQVTSELAFLVLFQAEAGRQLPQEMECCHHPAAQLRSRETWETEERGKVVFGVNKEGLMWQHEMLHRVTTRRSE